VLSQRRKRARSGRHIVCRDLLTRREDFEPIWPVLQRYLGEIRPACTMMVTGLLDPRMLIEIEVTALKA